MIMNDNLQELLNIQAIQISIPNFILNLFIVAILTFILSKVYINFGNSLSNRQAFAKNFIILGITTMIIITIVKSSLALSLGLVGALSIVRFRTAIKEPEELGYLFFVISLGLGLGADQKVITMVGFLFTLIIIIINSYSTRKETNKNISLTLSCPKNNNNNILMDINNIMSKSCSKIELKRFDESNKEIEFIFFIELEGFESLNELKINLLSYNENINISLMNNKELY
jgi:hypothetical protein